MPLVGATQLEPVNYLGQYLGGVEAARGMRAAQQQEQVNALQLQAAQQTQANNAMLQRAMASGASDDDILRIPGGAQLLEQRYKAQRERTGAATADIERRMKAADFLAQSAGSWLRMPNLNKAQLAPWVAEMTQNGLISPEAAARFEQMPDDPAMLAQGLQMLQTAGLDTKSQLEQQFTSQDLGGSVRLIATPKFGGGPARVVQGSVSPVTMTPAEAARVALERQRVGLEGRRVALAEQRVAQGANAPAAASTTISPKVKEKREAAFPKVQQALNSATHDISTLIRDLSELRSHPGLASITGGIEGRLPSIREKSTGAQSLLDRIMSKGQLRSLMQLRENSPTGGALGNVSNQDLQVLRDAFAALNQSQGIDDFRRRIDQTINDLRFADQNIRTAFEEEYSYRNEPAAGGGNSVFDEADRILRGE